MWPLTIAQLAEAMGPAAEPAAGEVAADVATEAIVQAIGWAVPALGRGDAFFALDAMTAAAQPHAFLGIDAAGQSSIVRTRGNPDVHIVLRGGAGARGCARPRAESAARHRAGLGKGASGCARKTRRTGKTGSRHS